jgi:hypothetical protein
VRGEARFIRVVAGHQQLGAAQFGADRQDRFEVGHAGVGLEAQDFQVEHLDAGVAQARLGLPAQVGVSHQREVLLLLGGRHQAQAHMAVAGRAAASTMSGGDSSSTVRAAREKIRSVMSFT